MNEKTSAELQQEAEIARARVTDTAESIRSKMTPGQLIDEFSGMFAGGDGGAMLRTLKSQVSANPLPVALVGVGLAWLMAGQGGQKPTDINASQQNSRFRDVEGRDGGQDYGSGEAWVGGMTDSVSSAADSTASMVGNALEEVRAGVSDAARSVSGSAARYGSNTAEKATKAAAATADLLRQEPLVLAALGLALGTAVGAMLPRTDFEDQQLGRASDEVRDKASDLLERGVESAKDVAAQAYQTVKDEADKKGFSADPASVIDQVSEVVKSAASKTEKTVRQKIQEAADTPAKPEGSDFPIK